MKHQPERALIRKYNYSGLFSILIVEMEPQPERALIHDIPQFHYQKLFRRKGALARKGIDTKIPTRVESVAIGPRRNGASARKGIDTKSYLSSNLFHIL